MINYNKIIKQTAKKLYKLGFYNIAAISLKHNILSFTDGFKVFSLQPDPCRPDIGMLFLAGYVQTWIEQGQTFESEYNSLGPIEKAFFKPFYIQNTDNPDFITRTAKAFTLGTI